MEHFAIDLGSVESQVCIRNEKAEILLERRVRNTSLRTHLKRRPKSRVVMETCTEAFAVAEMALELGHEVRVVPATLVRALGVGARGIKTDVRDARALSEASTRIDLPSVHIPSTESREGKTMCNARGVLVRARTMMINATRAHLRATGVQLKRGSSETLPDRVEKTLRERSPSSANSTQQVISNEAANAASIAQQTATTSACEQHACNPWPPYIDRLLRAMRELNDLIEEADQELAARVAPDPVAQRLMTIPGVGPVCATRFITTVDTIERFESTEALQSYLGLVPGEVQSSTKQRRTRTIRCGAEEARAALVQSAWCMWRTRKTDPLVLWAKEIEKRRGKQIAITALARKIATVMFVMWRNGTTYDPCHASRKNSEREETHGMS